VKHGRRWPYRLLARLADPPGGVLHDEHLLILRINLDRRRWHTDEVASVEAKWQKKGPTYAITRALFKADGTVEELGR
jgi:hypothetical protein